MRKLSPLAAVFFLLTTGSVWATDTGFLVLAPDRGFLGNDETREAFDEFKRVVPTSVLAFATEERTAENLQHALETLERENSSVDEVVVLPLFLTQHHALYQSARAALEGSGRSLTIAPVFGQSYLAEEVLFDHVRALLPDGHRTASSHGSHGAPGSHEGGHDSHGHSSAEQGMQHGTPRLVVIASGAANGAAAERIEADLGPVVRRAADKFGLVPGEVVVLYDWSAPTSEREAAFARVATVVREAAVHGPTLVVPFNLAPRLTTMMADWTRVEGELSAIPDARFDGQGVIPHPNVARWLIREANGYLPLAADEIGVILVPHGSDYNWNEAMRAAMAPIRDRYVTEDAFSMVDPFVVERAVRRLEEKGVKAAVLVRIFSLESSFQNQAEYILGLREEYRGPHADRIASHLRFATTGGMEAHPLLAEAMLDRAREISQDPEQETVVLVAHGTGGDAQNARWMENLESIANHIRSRAPAFRGVKFHTWREDWPDKREASIAAIRQMVDEAGEDGGTALVIPVRTIDQGPEADFLEGLTYRHGTGFAPHPNFVKWLDEMIQQGIAQLRPQTDVARASSGSGTGGDAAD